MLARIAHKSARADASDAVENAHVVYFIQGVTGGPIKIGTSAQVRRRLASIQGHSPVQMRVLATMPGDARCEKEMHRRFAKLRLHGEWFKDEPPLTEYIDEVRTWR